MTTLYGYPYYPEETVEEKVQEIQFIGNQFCKPRAYKSVCSSETIEQEEDLFSYIINTIKDFLF